MSKQTIELATSALINPERSVLIAEIAIVSVRSKRVITLGVAVVLSELPNGNLTITVS